MTPTLTLAPNAAATYKPRAVLPTQVNSWYSRSPAHLVDTHSFLTTVMKAHLFATSLLGLTAHAAVHHDIAGLAARQAFPSDAAVSVCYTYTSTYLTLVTPTTSGGAATPTPPAFFPVILGIEPLGVAKRDLEKRAGLGGFVTNDPANPNALNCSGATVFQLQIGGGVFLDTGIPLFTTSGSAFQEFRATGPSPAGAITTTFTGQDGSILTWANSAFFGGAATFCQVPATGQVYSTFQGTANVPAGCVTVQLRIYAGKIYDPRAMKQTYGIMQRLILRQPPAATTESSMAAPQVQPRRPRLLRDSQPHLRQLQPTRHRQL